MSKIQSFIKEIGSELLIIFLFIFLLNTLIGKEDVKINADGIGYYDYLPSLFIHHDFIRKDISVSKDLNYYKRINSLEIYNDYHDRKLNKYPCGTAILQSPFFISTYLTTDLKNDHNDGYQKPFQKTIFHAAIFYLLFGIYFLKKLLELYSIKKPIITFIQLLVVLGTSLVHYVNIDPAYSHVYSFFAITAFLYFSKEYFISFSFKKFVFACLFLGLILLLRQINVLIICFIPFIAGSFKNLIEGIRRLFLKPKYILSSILIVLCIVSIQCFVWYFQVGDFIVYAYQNEGFNFLNPEFFNILFSYRKGLFVYTPVLFIALLSTFYLVYKRQFFLFFTWLGFFIILSYFLSSWWCWFYGGSFGLRAYIEYYSFFFIPLAIFLNGIKKIVRNSIVLIALITIPLNLIQAYQYKEYILHWFLMDKDKYWSVFLKTEDKFKGFVWKNSVQLKDYEINKVISLGDISANKHLIKPIYIEYSNTIPKFKNASVIQVSFENEFKEFIDSKIRVSILNNAKNRCYYWYEIDLIQFADIKFNTYQRGKFNFQIQPVQTNENFLISVELITNEQPVKLKDIKLKFLTLR